MPIQVAIRTRYSRCATVYTSALLVLVFVSLKLMGEVSACRHFSNIGRDCMYSTILLRTHVLGAMSINQYNTNIK